MNFKDLIAIFELSGWQALGKISNPLTGKAEVNLAAAGNAVEILMLLREKSRNNLTPEEEKSLAAAIANLQLNYTEAVKKKNLAGNEQKVPETAPTEAEVPRKRTGKKEGADAGKGEKTGGESAGKDK